jgi:hypothetical protein
MSELETLRAEAVRLRGWLEDRDAYLDRLEAESVRLREILIAVRDQFPNVMEIQALPDTPAIHREVERVRAMERVVEHSKVLMKHEAFQLGLIRTGHALDVATTQVGWEWADIRTGEQKDLDLRTEGQG